MTTLAFTRSGSGAPLVLLHGIGLTRHSWDPVIPALAGHFDVIAVDLPGFGDSEPMPPQVEPLPAALAAAVAGLLDELGIAPPTSPATRSAAGSHSNSPPSIRWPRWPSSPPPGCGGTA